MNILNVLTVEDELPMRQELELYPWESWGCIHVGSCSNGKEALNFCRGYKVDVVISDITMPLIDGMELTQKLQTEFPNIKVILLTCHRDFSYAQEALRLRAVDYILKMDLCNETLAKAIEKVREQVSDEASVQNTERNKIRYQVTKLLAEHGTKHINDEDKTLLEKGLKEINYALPSDGYDFFLFVKDTADHWLFIQEEIATFFQTQPLLIDWFVIRTGLYYLCLRTQNPASLSRFMDELTRHLEELSYLNIHPSQLYIYTKRDKLSFDDIFTVMGDSDAIDNYHFYHPSQKIILSSQLIKYKDLSPDIKEAFYCLVNSSLPEQESFPDDLYRFALSVSLYPEQFKTLIASWLQNVLKPDFQKDTLFSRLKNYSSIEEVLLHVQNHLSANNDTRIRREIKKAIDIIDLKYADAISLSYVAEQVGLSAPYLSKIFNAELGETFNEYLTRIRMEHADKLIQESNKKMYEIAELVGIPSYRYFSKLYKKWKEKE